jgi:fatty acid desaturase
VLNHRYVRHAPMDRTAHLQEALASAFVWTVVALYAMNIVPANALAGWYFVTTVASAINTIRTLAAHRYDHDVSADQATTANASLTMTEQLLDSCTIRPTPGPIGRCAVVWRELWAPVGLRYHALHHWIPSLPYHNLGRAHRLLLATLGANTPYEATQYPAIAPVVVDLIRRASKQRS